jgi:hypothetical protein
MNNKETNHVANRSKVISALIEEVVGPSPQGEAIDCRGDIKLSDPKVGFKPWRQLGSGEEILTQDSPTVRYGVGVLFPAGTYMESEASEPILDKMLTTDEIEEAILPERALNTEKPLNIGTSGSVDNEDDFEYVSLDQQDSNNIDLYAANVYKPSVMAVSLMAEFPNDSFLRVEIRGFIPTEVTYIPPAHGKIRARIIPSASQRDNPTSVVPFIILVRLNC